MQNIMKNVMRPLLSLILVLSVTIYAPVIGLCTLPLVAAFICKVRVIFLYMLAAFSAATATALWVILPKAALLVIPAIDSWRIEDSLATPAIIFILIALSYIERIKLFAITAAFGLLCSISLFNSGALITGISDKNKASIVVEMDKAVMALNHLDIADCLTTQETMGNLCFIFDNKLPIESFDKNITKTLIELSNAKSGHYSWQQKIYPQDGKIFNKVVSSPYNEGIDASIAVRAGETSTTLLINTTSVAQVRLSSLLTLIQCIAMLGYGSLCLGLAYTSITSSKSGYLFVTLSLMLMATFQSSMSAPTFLLPCLVLLSIQNIKDMQSKFMTTEKIA